MRKCILIAVLAVVVALPVLAQPLGFGMFGMGGGNLLARPEVQKELKLSEDQKKALGEAQTSMREAMVKASQDKDRDAMKTAIDDYTKAVNQVKDKLTAAQSKRLMQIEVQAAAQMNQLAIFIRKEVAEALKLTDDQKATVKELQEDMQKDIRELMEDAKGDRTKMVDARKKMQTMSKETFSKFTGKLTAEQKTAWKEMQGEPFKMEFGPGKGKGRPKKDDF